MAKKIIYEPSRTLQEFRLLPGLTNQLCTSDKVNVNTLLTSADTGKKAVSLKIPLVSAAMQAVSGVNMAVALGREGGAAFLYCSQSIMSETEMVASIKKSIKSGELPIVAAINTHDYKERVSALTLAGVDAVSLDSSDGFSHWQQECLLWIKNNYPKLVVIAGNIITEEGFNFLVENGADSVKVGMGGGSICITQEQKGTGRGLATSIIKVCEARDAYFTRTKKYIPIIADGGIVHCKDISIALALGADVVMMGRYFASVDESPTEKISIKNLMMKPYWGEGSARAQEWKASRYMQNNFLEGVEGFVEYTGSLSEVLSQSLHKIKASISSCGAANLTEFRQNTVVELISAMSIREGQVHDIHLPGMDGSYISRSWGN